MTVTSICVHACRSACGEYSKAEDGDLCAVLLSLGYFVLSSWVFNVLLSFGKNNSTLPTQSVWLPQKRVQLERRELGSNLKCPQLLVPYGHFCCSLLNVLIRKVRARVLSRQHAPEGWRRWGSKDWRRAHPFPHTVPVESAGFHTQRTFACCKQSTVLGKHLPRLLRICIALKHTWSCAGAISQVPAAVCSQPATNLFTLLLGNWVWFRSMLFTCWGNEC